MNNSFEQGQEVVCISDNFPVIKEYGGTGKEATSKPQKNETIIIDEILGEFLRFDKYDTEESCNWWKHDRFAPTEEKIKEEQELEEILKEW